MSETTEYDGLVRGMGDVIYDTGGVGESLYHYDDTTAAKMDARRQEAVAKTNGLADDPAPAQVQRSTAAAPAATPRRGLKTPIVLGLSAGALAAAGVYGWLRWRRPNEEAPAKLAGVAGGVSGLGVLVTVLAARGAGALKS